MTLQRAWLNTKLETFDEKLKLILATGVARTLAPLIPATASTPLIPATASTPLIPATASTPCPPQLVAEVASPSGSNSGTVASSTGTNGNT